MDNQINNNQMKHRVVSVILTIAGFLAMVYSVFAIIGTLLVVGLSSDVEGGVLFMILLLEAGVPLGIGFFLIYWGSRMRKKFNQNQNDLLSLDSIPINLIGTSIFRILFMIIIIIVIFQLIYFFSSFSNIRLGLIFDFFRLILMLIVAIWLYKKAFIDVINENTFLIITKLLVGFLVVASLIIGSFYLKNFLHISDTFVSNFL